MSVHTIYSLTSGPIEGTFEAVVASIQNYGFRQSVFEIESLPDSAAGKEAAGKEAAGAVIVLCPSSTPAHYLQMKPGDKVYCPGLSKNAAGAPALYRIRRMAEGTYRNTMTERR